MKYLGLGVTEWIAVITFVAGVIYGLMKFYNLFMSLGSSINRLNQLINNLESRFDDHEHRITKLEEQNKTIFHEIGGREK